MKGLADRGTGEASLVENAGTARASLPSGDAFIVFSDGRLATGVGGGPILRVPGDGGMAKTGWWMGDDLKSDCDEDVDGGCNKTAGFHADGAVFLVGVMDPSLVSVERAPLLVRRRRPRGMDNPAFLAESDCRRAVINAGTGALRCKASC